MHDIDTIPMTPDFFDCWKAAGSPRQILAGALVLQAAPQLPENRAMLARYLNWNSKLCHYGTGASRESTAQTFYNQALNTFPNYGIRSYGFARSFLDGVPENAPVSGKANIRSFAASDISTASDIYITDPPYADAVQYDEITEFFIAWLRKNPPAPFNEWIWDSRRNIAIKGEGQSFKVGMIEAYRAMAEHMEEENNRIFIDAYWRHDGEAGRAGNRLGCDVIASDLNPIACMLSWASFNIVGANPARHAEIVREMRLIADNVDETITALGIEHDADGNRAKLYLYCIEVRCPRTGWMVPVSPTWMLSKKRNTIARLIPDPANKRYEIEILNGVTDDEVEEAEVGTLRDGRLFHPMLNDDLGISMKEIRGDYRNDEGESVNRLRPWEKTDVRPRLDDIFQERLYAIQWMDGNDLMNGKGNPYTWFASVTAKDLEREKDVAEYVEQHLAEWQRDGLVSDMEIEPGAETARLIRERGWKFWHQLFI